MIYDQPCLYEDKVYRHGLPCDDLFEDAAHPIRVVATKPRVNLKLVSRQFAEEYGERCAGQNKLFVRTPQEISSPKYWLRDITNIATNLNILHLYLGKIDFEDDVSETQWWFGDIYHKVMGICKQLPSLRKAYLKLYVGSLNIKLDDLEKRLRSLVSIPKIEQLKIIHCDDPAKCWDLSTRKHVLVDWKCEEGKAPTVITGRASAIEYAESCCDGLSYEGPRVGEVAWDEYGNYLGRIGEDREVFMRIPSEFLFDAGLHYAEGEGIPPDLLRAAGLGSYVDGFKPRRTRTMLTRIRRPCLPGLLVATSPLGSKMSPWAASTPRMIPPRTTKDKTTATRQPTPMRTT